MTVSTGLSQLSTGKMTLVPIDLNDVDQRAEFKQQRVVCGWDYFDESLQRFIEKQEKKLKSLFWITVPGNADDKKVNGEESPVIQEANGHASSSHIRAGHISLDSYTDPPDPELAREDRSILTVQTFFILPEYRSGGLGRAAMDLVEALATQEPYGSPQCHTLALTTVSKKHILIDAPEWKGIWKKFGRFRN